MLGGGSRLEFKHCFLAPFYLCGVCCFDAADLFSHGSTLCFIVLSFEVGTDTMDCITTACSPDVNLGLAQISPFQ